MNKTIIDCTFRIIYFSKPRKFIGLAWNYDEAAMFSTLSQDSYTAARTALELTAKELRCNLKWFDGSYTCAGEGHYLLNEEPPTQHL